MNSNSTPVSVTSDEVDNFKRSLSQLQTPSALERVVDWMGINEKDSLACRDDKNSNNSSTFFRCDYKVNTIAPEMKNEDANITSVFNRSVPLCESPNSLDSKLTFTQEKNEPQLIATTRNEYISDNQLRRRNVHVIAASSVERKKKELCSYLKLMTRDVKKEIFHSQFRRSTRVQNLERKKRVLTNHKCHDEEVCSEKSARTIKSRLSDGVETFALQSFEDLNMIVDTSKYPLLQEHIDEKIFNFVMPPDTVLKEFNDFIHWIEPFVIDQNYRNGTFNKQNSENLDNKELTEINYCNNKKLQTQNSEIKKIHQRNEELNDFKEHIEKKEITTVDTCKKDEKIKNNRIEQESEYSTRNNLIDRSLSKHNRENKCIILLHDETIVNGFDEDFEKNIPNIEEDINHLEVCENIKIRIDYESEHSKQKLNDIIPSIDYNSEPNNVQLGSFIGFSKEDIEKSEELLSEFNFCIDCIQYVPKNEDKKWISQKALEEQEVECLCPKQGTKYNCRHINAEVEETKSNSSTTSDSYSSVQSKNSSTSDSTSISEKTSLKKHPSPDCERISPSQILPLLVEIEPFSEKMEVQSLHDLLKRQAKKVPSSVVLNSLPDWDSDNSMNGKQKFSTSKNNSHFISFSKENGSIQNAVYVDFHLILVQEFAVSMWNQTALGNVLGAQNLWIFNGDTRKLILNKECVRKKSLEMAVSMENCVAYVELWTKEHKSDIRQGPVADVFAIVYFWIQKLNKMDKKVHQLENINGFSDDVQYVVLKSSLEIVVSWHSVIDDVKITQVHLYKLANDFQKIVNVRAMSKVEHYVSSLHNIEDCEELLMGCGEHTITLWNIEHGYIVASIKLNDIKLSLSTLWTKCDRGILFTVQQCVDKELRLIAINGRSHSWKKLKSYKPPEGFERIQNVYIENGVLISFYEEGILCWKAQTEEQILEETHETDMKYFPSGKYVIMTTEKTVCIRHALTHLLTAD